KSRPLQEPHQNQGKRRGDCPEQQDLGKLHRAEEEGKTRGAHRRLGRREAQGRGRQITRLSDACVALHGSGGQKPASAERFMMSVISPERAREQLALMYVNRSQGITGVQLVEKNGENELVVDILAPFWTQVGGRLPKTWGGLKVSVAIFDATGEPYPAWLNLQHNSNRPALVFSEERDPYGPPPPRRRSQGSPFGPPPRIRVSEPSRPPVARAVMALLLLLGSFFLLKFS